MLPEWLNFCWKYTGDAPRLWVTCSYPAIYYITFEDND